MEDGPFMARRAARLHLYIKESRDIAGYEMEYDNNSRRAYIDETRMRWMRSVFSVGHSSRGALSQSLNLPDLWIFRPPPHRLSISCTNLDNSRTDMMNTHTCVGGHCKLSSSTTCHELGEMCDVKQNLDDPSPYWVLARVGLNGWHLSY